MFKVRWDENECPETDDCTHGTDAPVKTTSGTLKLRACSDKEQKKKKEKKRATK